MSSVGNVRRSQDGRDRHPCYTIWTKKGTCGDRVLDVARQNARVAALEITWREGDVESLPFPPGSFDVVISQFGHMFGPRPDLVGGEMLKETDPGRLNARATKR